MRTVLKPLKCTGKHFKKICDSVSLVLDFKPICASDLKVCGYFEAGSDFISYHRLPQLVRHSDLLYDYW